MAARRSQPTIIGPTLAPERAHAAVKKQLESLNALRGENYIEAEHEEQEWMQLTQNIIERSFGNPSTNLNHFFVARSAGEHFVVPYGAGIPHGANQHNFEERIKAFEAFLKGVLSELSLIMPEKELQGQYNIGDEYRFYRDIKAILSLATSEVMIVDPYLSTEIFDTYIDGIEKTLFLRMLTNNLPGNVKAIANKYAVNGKIQLRSSGEIHDRLLLIDQRVWFIGQSIKDAAKKKPTYIVEQDGALVRQIYEGIWNRAEVVI
jgi:hypothetical protein